MNDIAPGSFVMHDLSLPILPPSGPVVLSPAQSETLHRVEKMASAVPLVGIMGATGTGKTTLLRALAERHGGVVVSATEMTLIAEKAPADQFLTVIGSRVADLIQKNPLVLMDDLEPLMVAGANTNIRPGFVRAVMRRLRNLAQATGHRLILSGHVPENWETPADQFGQEAAFVTIPAFEAEDYKSITTAVSSAARVAAIDFDAVYRFAGHLNAHQLKLALVMLNELPSITTDDFLRSLEENVMVANTRTDEVEAIKFSDLPGHEEIVEALQTNIVLPMENRELASRMGLKPKRGVLLFGPPGTGKTSIGRALAHHMRGRFFLIDGSIVSEPPVIFFLKVESIVREAKKHAPSVLFIDDADVLFGIDHIQGLSRYLLSLLDGVESETASGVCVMMTAMDVTPIPPALLRSGRVELWLETKAPDEATRAQIIRRWTEKEPELFGGLDCAAIAALTHGFTPADIRRLVGDSKARMASDIVRERPLRDATAYFHDAVAEILSVRRRMGQSLQGPGSAMSFHQTDADS